MRGSRRRRVTGWGLAALTSTTLIMATSTATPAAVDAPAQSTRSELVPVSVVSTGSELGPVSAQDAVRPQLPRRVDFALRPVQQGVLPQAQVMTELARERWTSPSLGSSKARAIVVRDALTDEHLIDIRPSQPLTPASTTKLLSAAAIMSVLPPGKTFTTRTVSGATPSDVVLVAGGDQLLASGRGSRTAIAGRAGLQDLAQQTASSVREQGIEGPVRVWLDTSYAEGPDLAPGWTDFWVENGFAGRISMVALAQDRALPYDPAPSNLAISAANSFRQSLAGEDIDVSGQDIERMSAAGSNERVADGATATATATAIDDTLTLGQVESAPVRDVLALALATSDNAMIEQLSRQAAVAAGVGPGQDAVNDWVLSSLRDFYDVDTEGATLADTSGLSDGTQVPTRLVADVLVRAASGRYPAAQSVATGLPIAGYSGTLDDRFVQDRAASGRGVVRAKTGSLPSVTSLAGTIMTADGRLLVFALSANDIGDGGAAIDARAEIDALIAQIADCGC